MSDQQMHDLANIFARKISNIPQPDNPSEFTYGGGSIEKIVIKTPRELETAVEREITDRFGLELLFTQNDEATSTKDWAEIVYSSMETAYDLENVKLGQVQAAVRAVKDKHRVRIVSNMGNNLYAAMTEKDIPPYSVDDLKERLQGNGAFLEDADDEIIQQIFEGTVGQEVDYRAGWTVEPSDITSYPKGQSDLETLIRQCSGNLYSDEIGTIVGGIATNGKRVPGLNDPSARIDRQSPPPNPFNVQYQVGNASCAAVI